MRRIAIILPVSVVLVVAALTIGPVNTALAHPLGNFTVNRYAGLLVRPNAITVDYVVDMAEIPAYQEIRQRIDTNGDGATDTAERTAYRERTCAEIPHNLALSVSEEALALTPTASALEFPPGAGGLVTLRLTCTFQAKLANVAAQRSATFRDGNFADRIGWRELVVQGDGTSIRNTNAFAATISNRLRSYPNDMLSSPPQETEADFEFQPSAAAYNPANITGQGSVLDRTKDSFAALISVGDLSLPVVLLSLLVAMGLGAVHAISPGHGKTIMAAYLVGTRGTIPQALLLGLTVTISHTLGVLSLGLLTLFASRYILPDSLYPWLTLASGLIVLAMGANLVWNRWRMMRLSRRHDPTGHDHRVAHNAGGPGHHHHHHHGAEGDFREALHAHTHSNDELDAELAHAHSHLPRNFQEEGLSWQSLVGLGLVGGFVPSASALIVLLAAISLQRIAFGIVLVIAFGLGMALVLVGTGVVLVRASHFLEQRRFSPQRMTWLPLASAVVVIGAGLYATAQAAWQMGVWKP
jgi:nickel/cobalt transporter (NicO) family protein